MSTLFFIIMLIISAAVMTVLYSAIKHELGLDKSDNTEISDKRKKITILKYNPKHFRIASFFSILMFIPITYDIFNLVNFGIYNTLYALLGSSCFIFFLISEGVKKRRSKFFLFASKLVVVVTILELTIFNAPCYRLTFGDYKEKTFTASEITVEKGGKYVEDWDCIEVTNGKELLLVIDGYGSEIGNIKTDIAFDGCTKFANYVIDVNDETQTSEYRYDTVESRISSERDCSQFAECYFSGEVSRLRVKITPAYDGNAYIYSITCNTQRPFEASWMRYLFLIICGCLIYGIMKTSLMQRNVKESRKLVNKATLAVTLSMCVVASVVTIFKYTPDEWKDQFHWTNGNQLTQEIPDAFSKGQTSLLVEPSEELLEFDNPYDRQYREESEIPVEWDHVYYNGKYYSYYGIAPAVLLFLPYYKLVGYYCPDAPAVLLFSIIGIIGLSFLFRAFMRKFFDNIPVGMYIASLIVIQSVSGIWFSIGRPWFYEIAIAAGFAFITWAAYFLISSNVIGKGKISLPRSAVSSFLFAGAVLCRPTLVLYCICAAAFFIFALPKVNNSEITNEKKKLITPSGIRYLLCALLPMFILGGIQMWYNYSRFDNPFEFGIQYSLTINDFTKSQFHTRLSLIPIYNYLFNPPIFSPEFPIVSTEFSFLNSGGFFHYDYVSTYNSSGLFFLALPMFAYFISSKAVRRLPDRFTKIKCISTIVFPCIIIPVIIVASVWESGYAVRYMADFAWEMIIGAFAIIFFLYSKTENETLKHFARIFLCFSMVWAVIVGGVQGYNQAFRFDIWHYDFPEMAYDLENAFLFWK